MKKRCGMNVLVAVVSSLVFLMSLISCKPTAKTAYRGQNKIRVVTTLFPLYDMAKSVGGDKAEVSLLLPPGVEPHSFEPRPGDIVRINEADIFVYTGKFMEPWADGIVRSAVNRNLIVVDASRGTKMIPGVSQDKDEAAGSFDPHIWLDFDNAGIMVGNIVKAFEMKDMMNKNFYEHKGADYSSRLAELDSAYRTALADCKKKEIIYAGHYAFGYLAHRYGLSYIAAQGVSPDAEPTARDLAMLVEQIKKDRLRYIFYEELTSPKIAETIAGETRAKMLLLNAAHNLARDQVEKGVSFFDILKDNLQNLKTGLDCR